MIGGALRGWGVKKSFSGRLKLFFTKNGLEAGSFSSSLEKSWSSKFKDWKKCSREQMPEILSEKLLF